MNSALAQIIEQHKPDSKGAVAPRRSGSDRGVDYAVDIVRLSKQFRRQTLRKGGYTTIKSWLLNVLLGRKSATQNVTRVLRDLTLRIPAGASVGVIGRNGAGKSTLLKLISGIYRPDSGSIHIKGRIAALIELGAGFHPDFSGRENLFLAGIMHGMTRAELQRRFDEIVRFAELEEVIDDPVRTYSSGMFMRLGFSLAVHCDPDILIVDEVLAVGDAAFVHKCVERISLLRKQGKTLILVTHDLDAVERWCDEALWLHDGEVQDRGEPRRVIDFYREFIEHGEEAELRNSSDKPCDLAQEGSVDGAEQGRWGSREIELSNVRLLNRVGDQHQLFHSDDFMRVAFNYAVHQQMDDVVFGVAINRIDGLVMHGTNTEIERQTLPNLKGSGEVYIDIERLGLQDGTYTLDVAVHRADGYPYDYHRAAVKFAVRWPLNQVGVLVPQLSWQVNADGY